MRRTGPDRAECRALQDAIYRYMDSDDFRPETELSASALKEIAV